jgi:hypothetical protein
MRPLLLLLLSSAISRSLVADKAGPMAGPTGILVNNLPEALQAVDTYKSKGYDQIKLYSSIEPGWVQPIAVKAHGLGMRVCGHIPAYMTASQAVDAGYDEITHINMIVLNFFGDTIDTRNMTRLTLPGQKAYDVLKAVAAYYGFSELTILVNRCMLLGSLFY